MHWLYYYHQEQSCVFPHHHEGWTCVCPTISSESATQASSWAESNRSECGYFGATSPLCSQAEIQHRLQKLLWKFLITWADHQRYPSPLPLLTGSFHQKLQTHFVLKVLHSCKEAQWDSVFLCEISVGTAFLHALSCSYSNGYNFLSALDFASSPSWSPGKCQH